MRVPPISATRPAPLVEHQPDVLISDWRVLVTPSGHLIIAGMIDGRNTIRVSTKIIAVDVTGRLILTSSGRRYHIRKSEPSVIEQLLAIQLRLKQDGGLFENVFPGSWNGLTTKIQ